MNKTLSVLAATIVTASLSAGCGGKQNKATAKVPAVTASAPAGNKAPKIRTQRATGEMREALIKLHRVHFAFDTDKLLPESRVALEEAAELLAKYPDVEIVIDGHTDARGTTEYNLALGERRANAAADYLMRMGIDSSRLNVVTHGKEQLWDDGNSQLAHAKNRRAEFRLRKGNVRFVLDDGVMYDDRGRQIATKSK